MNVSGIVLNQVIVMFLLVLIGFLVVRANIITQKVNRGMCDLLLKIVIPFSIVNAYFQSYSVERTRQLGMAFLLSVVFHILSIVLSSLMFRKSDKQDYRIDRIGVVYSNCGFMGLPLLFAVFGEDGVFFGSAYIAVFNVLLWIHGIKTMKPEQKLGVGKILFNPGVIAIAVGLISYFFQIQYPDAIVQTVRHVSNINTPLAMVVIGGFFVSVKIKGNVTNLRNIAVAMTRVLILPLIFIGFLLIAQAAAWSEPNRVVALAMVVAAACPTAAAVVLLPESVGIDSKQGSTILALTTILSIVTLPLVTLIAGLFLL